MDLVNAPIRKSKMSRTFSRVLHIRAVDGIQKTKSVEKIKQDGLNNDFSPLFEDEDEKFRIRAAIDEAFLAKLLACISAFKAAYSQLQFSQYPYDEDGIQSADQMAVFELQNLSELKYSYLNKEFDASSLETTHLLAEIQEQKSLLKMYEISTKNLDSQLKLKDSEITFLREKLEESKRDNKLLEKRLNSSGKLLLLDNLHLAGLNLSHFVTVLKQTIKSIRSFVGLMIVEMESSGWDLTAAAYSIQPDITSWNIENHILFAFESFVSKVMFDGFNDTNLSLPNESFPHQKKHQILYFFDRFMELKSMKPDEYLASNPKSTFSKFCREKYLRLVNPKMELLLFGNLNPNKLVSSGEYRESTFFARFVEMAKYIRLLHCLALSLEHKASIFQVRKRSRFSQVYMESVNEEVFLSSDGKLESERRVAFMVVPGFKIGKIIIQCQVYLSSS